MEIRHLSDADMPQVQHVWRECFHDSDAFIRAYFDFAAQTSNGLGAFTQDGELLSDLFALKMTAQVGGTNYPCDFLAGCATLPEARRQNLMRTLIRTKLVDMRDQGVPVSFLHPFLHDFYRKFGYESVAYVRDYSTEPLCAKRPVIAKSFSEIPVDAFFKSYTSFVSQFENCFQRTRERMHAWLKLLLVDGGHAAFI